MNRKTTGRKADIRDIAWTVECPHCCDDQEITVLECCLRAYICTQCGEKVTLSLDDFAFYE